MQKVKLRRKYIKLSLAARHLTRIISTIREGHSILDNRCIYYKPLITMISESVLRSILDLTTNMIWRDHVLVRDALQARYNRIMLSSQKNILTNGIWNLFWTTALSEILKECFWLPWNKIIMHRGNVHGSK